MRGRWRVGACESWSVADAAAILFGFALRDYASDDSSLELRAQVNLVPVGDDPFCLQEANEVDNEDYMPATILNDRQVV